MTLSNRMLCFFASKASLWAERSSTSARTATSESAKSPFRVCPNIFILIRSALNALRFPTTSAESIICKARSGWQSWTAIAFCSVYIVSLGCAPRCSAVSLSPDVHPQSTATAIYNMRYIPFFICLMINIRVQRYKKSAKLLKASRIILLCIIILVSFKMPYSTLPPIRISLQGL